MPRENLSDLESATPRAKLINVTARPAILATLDGFAVEGGFDQPYKPTTCYSPASALGYCSTPGGAAGLWEQYEHVLDFVAQLGLDGVRLTVEWARLEPHRGEFDSAALARYQRVLVEAKKLGLRTTVVLIDAVWPAWLGAEAWLLPWIVPHVIAHAQRVGDGFGDEVDGLVGFARGRGLVRDGFLTGSAPPWRRGAGLDAVSAQAQVAELEATIRALDSWRSRNVTHSREIPVVDSATAMRALLVDANDASEIHLRSLVRGSGPTASAAGLIAREGDGWNVAVASDLSATWR